MELLIPSLVAILVAVAISFFVIPRLAPSILVVASAVVLAVALYSHYTRFGVTEYERATWVYNIGQYSGMIVLAAVILGAYFMFGSGGGNYSMSNSSMPSLSVPTIGGGFDTIFETSSSRIRELLRKGRITV